jgi:molybdopterin biosynthesis enzyme
VPTLEANGRVLAEDQASTHRRAGADNTQMDGYAVRAADCASGARDAAVASASRPAMSASRSSPAPPRASSPAP